MQLFTAVIEEDFYFMGSKYEPRTPIDPDIRDTHIFTFFD